MTENITPQAEVDGLLEAVHDWQAHEGITDATMLASVGEAQAIATLALVEQQRIANLIALYQADSDILDDPRFDAAKADIRKALGLS
ncbi:hypothetical protein D9V30_10315 [Mycetocola reblochoni]|uniref:Uncharacterized protein n=2 Tax=Mycetocola reblochoni TaxID=331618 RepID=A0A1R4JP02_9MICO|nr:hypothetical protein [Mycetocola reblochoni]RLP68374.1 hypothetical protein D9V30_10315 [Mycetocola reblochoni]SJN33991.1 hypothetical protein FM119_08695 [Mycetocola reblochoni REB411]